MTNDDLLQKARHIRKKSRGLIRNIFAHEYYNQCKGRDVAFFWVVILTFSFLYVSCRTQQSADTSNYAKDDVTIIQDTTSKVDPVLKSVKSVI